MTNSDEGGLSPGQDRRHTGGLVDEVRRLRETIETDRRRNLRARAFAIAVTIVLVALVVFVWQDSSNKRAELARIASSTNHALCTLRGDLARRVQDSRTFLKEHPEGIPGIPAAAIKQGIDNQQQTIDALASLDCRTSETLGS